MNKQKGYIKYVVVFCILVATFLVGAQLLGKENGDMMQAGDGGYVGAEDAFVDDSGGNVGAAGGDIGSGGDLGPSGLDIGTAGDIGSGGNIGTAGGDIGSGVDIGSGGVEPADAGSISGGAGGNISSMSGGGIGTGSAGGVAVGSSSGTDTLSGTDISDSEVADAGRAGNATADTSGTGYKSSNSGKTNQLSEGDNKDSDTGFGKGKGKNYGVEEDEFEAEEDTVPYDGGSHGDAPDDEIDDTDDVKLPPNGTYTSKGDVALYIHTYHRLPVNFITKKQAKNLGWTGGKLESFAPGMCIGGDSFGNYEGVLPGGKEYHECDIDTLRADQRGQKRIVYSEDFDIYYTGDHYKTFEKLY